MAEETDVVGVRFTKSQRALINGWRRKQEEPPTLSGAVRQLAIKAAEAEKELEAHAA